jgi:hypothetical protein
MSRLAMSSVAAKSSEVSYRMSSLHITIFSTILMESAMKK